MFALLVSMTQMKQSLLTDSSWVYHWILSNYDETLLIPVKLHPKPVKSEGQNPIAKILLFSTRKPNKKSVESYQTPSLKLLLGRRT